MTKKKSRQGKVVKTKPPASTVQPKVDSLNSKLDKLMKVIPRGSFAALGGAAGGPVGAALGAGISALTGYGDYKLDPTPRMGSFFQELIGPRNKIKQNSILSSGVVPTFLKGGAVRIRHREYIGDIVAGNTPLLFLNRTFRINPGNSSTFPWLSTIANSFQQYVPKGMVVEFVSTSSEYTSNSAMGTLVIATNYNINDAAFTSLVEANNCDFAVAGKPSQNLMHAIECDPQTMSYKQYYTAQATEPVRATSDYGLLQVCTSGLSAAAGATLGQLWVTYDVVFIKPVIVQPSSAVIGYYSNWVQSLGLPLGQNTIANSIITANSVNSGSIVYNLASVSASTVLCITDDNDPVNAKNVVYCFKPGKLRFTFQGVGTGIASLTFTAGNNCTLGAGRALFNAATTISDTFEITVGSNASVTTPCTFTYDWNTSPTTMTNTNLVIDWSP